MSTNQRRIMTRTATALGTGPFAGYFTPAATLFELDPPLAFEGHEFRHVVASSMPDAGSSDAVTAVFATDGDGNLDMVAYMNHGVILELSGVEDIPGALDTLGYTIVPLPAPVPAV
ncbi:MAG: hypothetical protein ACXVYB_00090 [Arthrobacter sp.]